MSPLPQDYWPLRRERVQHFYFIVPDRPLLSYVDTRYNADTAVKFMQHLQRHEDTKNKPGLNCRKCALKFVDEKSAKQHAEQDHNSYREFEDLEAAEPETGVQMPPPEERGVKTATRKSSLAKSLPQQVGSCSPSSST